MIKRKKITIFVLQSFVIQSLCSSQIADLENVFKLREKETFFKEQPYAIKRKGRVRVDLRTGTPATIHDDSHLITEFFTRAIWQDSIFQKSLRDVFVSRAYKKGFLDPFVSVVRDLLCNFGERGFLDSGFVVGQEREGWSIFTSHVKQSLSSDLMQVIFGKQIHKKMEKGNKRGASLYIFVPNHVMRYTIRSTDSFSYLRDNLVYAHSFSFSAPISYRWSEKLCKDILVSLSQQKPTMKTRPVLSITPIWKQFVADFARGNCDVPLENAYKDFMIKMQEGMRLYGGEFSKEVRTHFNVRYQEYTRNMKLLGNV